MKTIRLLLLMMLGWLALPVSVSALYNPSTGRRLNRDPIEKKGGLNLYSIGCSEDAFVISRYLIPEPIAVSMGRCFPNSMLRLSISLDNSCPSAQMLSAQSSLFVVRGDREEMHYPQLGLRFDLESNVVVSFGVSRRVKPGEVGKE